VVAIKEAKKTLASFSLELKNVLSLHSFDSSDFSEHNSLYQAESDLYIVQEEIQSQFIELLKTKFSTHSKYPNQINDLIEYINTKLKPNQHEVKVLIDEAHFLHTLLDNSDVENREEIMNELSVNNIEIQKVFKMNLEDDLIQRIKENSTESNKINKELDRLYAENKPDLNRSKIEKLIEERSFITESSRKNLETLKEVQHRQFVKRTSLQEFDYNKTLLAIEIPLLARSIEIRDILTKITVVIEDILKAKQ